MNFLYFVPAAAAVKEGDLERLSLTHAFESLPSVRQCTGPGAQAGALLSCAEPQDIRFEPDHQKWRQIPKSSVHIGYWTDSPPTVSELARPTQLAGELIRFSDGQDWLCPKARMFSEIEGQLLWKCALPRQMDLNDDGDIVVGDVQRQHSALWDLAMEYDDAYFTALSKIEDGNETVVFEFHRAHQLVADSLAVNYRVSLIELTMLGVLDTDMISRVLDVLMDRTTQYDWIKKKLQEGGGQISESSGSGSSGPELRIKA